ncbi:GDSL esterase/lipase [Sesamum alatum]|uniref:GDSL esterase/lipase n=1 Tax=Sesamum alatum TaxID=300844 RepID=A0AAE1XXA6_9LAMI|nr:GDSL esterase/lipase [Sesamum alatum]
MGLSRCMYGAFLVVSMVLSLVHGDPLVPALCIFGDSVVDAGNNNNLQTLIKSNFPPYGRDFVTHRPTGRFCNGKLATDFTAELPGVQFISPAYLSQEARGKNILNGVNFASAASGYYENTPQLYRALTLTTQLQYYRDWQSQVVSLVGRAKANDIFSGGIHLSLHPGSVFRDILMRSYSTFIQGLYNLGARRIGVTSLPPTGCLPAAITLFGAGSNQCVARLNQDAISFNNKLNNTSQNLKTNLPGLKLVVFDIYNPLLDMIVKPTDSGFFESRRACCGTGTIETSYLCKQDPLNLLNATQYVFWDGFHPSEAANEKLAQNLLEQGFDLIS